LRGLAKRKTLTRTAASSHSFDGGAFFSSFSSRNNRLVANFLVGLRNPESAAL
jgi:hypothetical protein